MSDILSSNEPHEPLESILVATDFSATAAAGVRWAAALARRHGARLELLHVVQAVEYPGELDIPPEVSEQVFASACRQLDEAAHELGGDLHVMSTVIVGRPSSEIVETAAKIDADLVVVGTRGLSSLEHFLLGSTAERVARLSPCPVLCIHPGDRTEAQEVRRILLPTDFSPGSGLALRDALRIFANPAAQPSLVLLHAWHAPDVALYAHPTGDGGVWHDEGLEEEVSRVLAQQARALRERGFAVETVVRTGVPADEIVAAAREHGADVIALGTHGRSGIPRLVMGSTAERVVHYADRPVLTVPLARRAVRERAPAEVGAAT